MTRAELWSEFERWRELGERATERRQWAAATEAYENALHYLQLMRSTP